MKKKTKEKNDQENIPRNREGNHGVTHTFGFPALCFSFYSLTVFRSSKGYEHLLNVFLCPDTKMKINVSLKYNTSFEEGARPALFPQTLLCLIISFLQRKNSQTYLGVMPNLFTKVHSS